MKRNLALMNSQIKYKPGPPGKYNIVRSSINLNAEFYFNKNENNIIHFFTDVNIFKQEKYKISASKGIPHLRLEQIIMEG